MSETAEIYSLAVGACLSIDGVYCIVTSLEPDGITTRPVTDAD